MLKRLGRALAATRERLQRSIADLFGGRSSVDANLLEGLEETLLGADLGVRVTQRLLDSFREKRRAVDSADAAGLSAFLKKELLAMMKRGGGLHPESASPYVIMMMGVNGVGKTTSIAKLARRFRAQGRSVLLIAGDTFRAAAAEQLAVWGRRADCPVFSHGPGADPSAVIFDGLSHASASSIEVVIADTAGRMHTKSNLMDELRKMNRVMGKAVPGAPHERLLVLDATTGQNALAQARQFHEAVGVTGIVLTKLDGTARGGAAVALSEELGLPITLAGVGESLEDLEDFSAEEFVEGLFGT